MRMTQVGMRWTGFGSRSIVEIITRYPLLLLPLPMSEEVEGDSNVSVGREAAEVEWTNSSVRVEKVEEKHKMTDNMSMTSSQSRRKFAPSISLSQVYTECIGVCIQGGPS